MNCHNIWGRKKKNDLEAIGAGLHNLLVPYDLLTDIDRAKDLEFSNELVKFLVINGYRLQNPIENNLTEMHRQASFKQHEQNDNSNNNSGG